MINVTIRRAECLVTMRNYVLMLFYKSEVKNSTYPWCTLFAASRHSDAYLCSTCLTGGLWNYPHNGDTFWPLTVKTVIFYQQRTDLQPFTCFGNCLFCGKRAAVEQWEYWTGHVMWILFTQNSRGITLSLKGWEGSKRPCNCHCS